jgi:hypothetical protein
MLLHLRQQHPALRRGRPWHIYWDQTSYAFARTSDEERILVVFNTGASTKSVRLSFADTPLQGAHRLTQLFGGRDAAVESDTIDRELAPHELQIYSVQ